MYYIYIYIIYIYIYIYIYIIIYIYILYIYIYIYIGFFYRHNDELFFSYLWSFVHKFTSSSTNPIAS